MYKAKSAGIAVEYVNPVYTSQTCSACGSLGKRVKYRFACSCGLLARADLNASRNLVRTGGTAVPPRAFVNPPDLPVRSTCLRAARKQAQTGVPGDGHPSPENDSSLRLPSRVIYGA
jgi:transposase